MVVRLVVAAFLEVLEARHPKLSVAARNQHNMDGAATTLDSEADVEIALISVEPHVAERVELAAAAYGMSEVELASALLQYSLRQHEDILSKN